MTIKRLLIANRGEIARRIQRSARQLGIHTIAVYSAADHDMPNVREADTAIFLGDGTAADTYLDIDKIIAAAKEAQADAIHPGYGFLSENTQFAAACEKANIIFVGPPANAIKLMGDKAAARLHMQQSGVPVLPGFDDKVDAARLQQEADKMGYPVLIKPVAGGGGKGMHAVESSADFAAILERAQREARNAFGDDQVLLERYLPRARHVEVQVFADTQGHCVYLFERDCSIQRRHQKIIEEAPAPDISAELRQRMGEAACAAALSVNYVGAGTVEFLLAPDGQFYFMEMNTRLQVEHPVTEMVTGEDLVAWQLAVAAGQPLPKQQDELSIQGHAMEVRLYAEDPWQNFLPSSGQIRHLQWPEGIRIDAGVEAGNTITSLYDPMIAKLISYGDNREDARQQLATALEMLQLTGLKHNTGFLHRLLNYPEFVQAQQYTRLIDDHPEILEAHFPAAGLRALAGLLAYRAGTSSAPHRDPWQSLSSWRPLGEQHYQKTLTLDGVAFVVIVGNDQASVNDDTRPLRIQSLDNRRLRITWGDEALTFGFHLDTASDEVTLFVDGQDHAVSLLPPSQDAAAQNQGFNAPMSGTLLLHHVKAGAKVAEGDAVVTLEAMKMEHTLHASQAGTVTALLANLGDHVEAGMQLVEFEADDE